MRKVFAILAVLMLLGIGRTPLYPIHPFSSANVAADDGGESGNRG